MTVTASTWKKGILLLVIVLALLVIPFPVAAFNTIESEPTASYSANAGNGNYIYEIIVDSLPIGTNQTHILNFKGATYLLEISSTTESYGAMKIFDVSLTHPNGTIETLHSGQLSIFDTYKTKIQPVYMQLQGFTLLQVDLNIGFSPMTAKFSDVTAILNSYDITSALPFTTVSGTFSGQTSKVFVYECTEAEFVKIKEGDLSPNVTKLFAEFFQWAWDSVMWFINKIPILGPQLVTVMTLIGTIAAEAIYWISYIVSNSWLIIGGLETLIAMMAFLLAGKRPTPERVIRKWADYNVRCVKGFIWAVSFVYEWLREFVNMVANVVSGLKPL